MTLFAGVTLNPPGVKVMPKKKRSGPQPYAVCKQCKRQFGNVRSDAKTCGPTCRKALSRANATTAAARKVEKKPAAKNIKCGGCGLLFRTTTSYKCPVCGEVSYQKVRL